MHRWKRFDQKWKAVLADVGIEIPFHMSDFMASQAGFRDWQGRDEDKRALLLVLARLIRKSVSFGIGEGVIIDEWNKANQVYALAQNHCTPYALASFFVIDKTLRWIGNHHDKEIKTAIVFESGDSGKGDFMWVMDQIRRRRPDLAPTYPQFGIEDDVVAFQACDFVAWEKRRAMGKRFSVPPEQAKGDWGCSAT